MKIYDISVSLCAELPFFPGDPRVVIEPVTTLSDGDSANASRISMSTHSGTHLDPPRHFDDCGLTVDALPLSLLVGRALVFHISGTRAIGPAELARLPLAGEERLLLRTDNSRLWGERAFVEDFTHITPQGARFLVEKGVKLVGIDYLSVEKADGNGDVHRILLENGVVILEGLDLSAVEAGIYELICLPLKIRGGDGAPARALLRSMELPGTDLHTTRWPLA
ncbi:MAG TPA: cyclase family protein [Geobacteraceae bacterium]|nr:cyclase family protein [Geobacteraceae bacterium]